jgi:ATP-binding cassette subfamily B protein
MGAALTLLEVILGIGVFYIIKLLIDVLTTRLSSPEPTQELGDVFLYLALAGGALLAAVAAQSLGTFVRTAQGMQVGEHIDREIHERAVAVDLGFYESPAYFDSLQRARQAGTQRPAQVVGGVLLFAKSLVFLAGVLVMLTGIDWRILPGILIAVAAVLAVRLHFTRKLFDWQRERAQLERRAAYLDWLITSDVHAKELRIGGLGGHLRDAYSELRALINAQHLRIERSKAIGELLVSALGALVFAGATAFLVFEALAGRQTIGNLVMFVLLFRRAESSGRELVQHAAKLYDDQLYLRQLFDFLSIERRIVAPAVPKEIPDQLTDGLRLEHVSFRYPSNREPTLSDITLHLPPGKVVALIGANGSGKTSLIKLITRLYDPDEGSIALDGTDIREFSPEEYRRLFSVIFQDYAMYASTVRDNIRFGDIARPPDDADIVGAAVRAGADGFVRKLNRGYDTPLSRMFDDGQELSIGQWQRLALARAFFPETRFIIMDEPSSALDPQAEFELFENFREAIGDRGALVISHRLSTVRMADYTYVLDQGRIVEQGTHQALVDQCGHYAELFEMQGRKYRV